MNNLGPEKLEQYLAPAEEIELHEKLELWAQSLIDRYNSHGFLSVLAYDPHKYPFQRIDGALHPAFQPADQEVMDNGVKSLGAGSYELEEIMHCGRETMQNKIFDELRLGCSSVMGAVAYETLVNDLRDYGAVSGHPESGLKILWARMHARKNNSALLTRHDHVMDTAIEQVALADAFSRAEFLKTERYIQNFGQFDLFKYSRQNFTNAGLVMSRLAIFGNPVISLLTKTSNVITLLPIYRSRDAGIDRKTIVSYNRLAKHQAEQAATELEAAGLSSLDHLAPTGETSNKIRDGEGNIVAINSKKVDLSVARKLVESDHFLWPVTIHLGGSRGESKAEVGDMRAIYRPDQVYAIMSEMARTTEKLAGVPVYEGPLPENLGSLAVHSSSEAI